MQVPFSKPPKRICILRLSALGDVTHVLPTLRTLQRHWPSSEITWIIGKTEFALVGDLPGVEFVVFDKSQGWRAYHDLHRTLKGRRFDVLLHMQVSLRASIASLAVRAPIRLGFDRKRARNGQWLFTNRKIRAVERQHVLDSFLEFPKALGLSETVLEWGIPIPDQARAFAEKALPPGRSILAINPCSSVRVRNFRNWSIARYAQVIDDAAQRHNLLTVLTGGPSDHEKAYAAAIVEATKNKPVNLVGKTTLKQLLAVLERATVVIAPDTGPAHMANAVGTPVIGLYASSNPERTGPYRFRDITVNRYPDALSKEGKNIETVQWGRRVRNPKIMDIIEVEDVIDNLKTVMV